MHGSHFVNTLLVSLMQDEHYCRLIIITVTEMRDGKQKYTIHAQHAIYSTVRSFSDPKLCV